MAKPEHVEIVKRGKEAIAEWRNAHPGHRLDLAGERFDGLELDGAELGDAILSGAVLNLTELRDANLQNADLRHAYLAGLTRTGARLTSADLTGAVVGRSIPIPRGDLTDVLAVYRGSTLLGADLTDTTLRFAAFESLSMREARFYRAHLAGTVFANVDLADAKGLGEVRHHGPSSVGIDTLYRSKGRIPSEFLRGCGVPQDLIDLIPSLVTDSPIQFYSCFISYSSQDEEFAQRLHGRMEQKKLRVWFAPEDIRGGRHVDEQIDEQVRIFDKLLVVLSENSMRSPWVRREIKKARERERRDSCRVLFPIRLVSIEAVRAWQCVDPDTGEDLAEEIRRYHILDFSNWKDHDAFEAAFGKLMEDLKAQ